LDHIRNHNTKITSQQNKYLSDLPRYVWVSEVSLPNIFTGNKHKLGDVVMRANATPQQHINGESLALAWFPGFIQLGHQLNLKEDWSIETHIPIARPSAATKETLLVLLLRVYRCHTYCSASAPDNKVHASRCAWWHGL
jgi:hypothetical protein